MKKILLLCATLCIFALPQTEVQAQEKDQEQALPDDLYALSLEELMNIDITTASKVAEKTSDAPGVITTITAKEIEQFGAVSLVDVLDRVVGVLNMSSHTFPQNVTSIRGDLATGYDTHVLMLVNGRPTRESLYGGLNMPMLLGMPVGMIDRIEFVRGPGSVLYGSNAYSGVINIITKKATENGGKVTAMAGSFDGAGTDGYITLKKNDLQVLAGFKHFQEQGWDFKVRDAANPTQPSGGRTTHTYYGEENQGANLMIEYKGLKVNSFILKSDQIAFGAASPIWSTGKGDTLSNTVTERTMIDVGYDFKISEKVNTDINVSYNHSSFDLPHARTSSFTEDYFAEVANFIRPLKNLNIVLGGTLYQQSGKYDVAGYSSMNLPPTVHPDVVARVRQGAVPYYTHLWYSAYLQGDYRVFNNLKLIAGAQYNKTEGIDGSLVPRAGVVYNITKKLGAKLLYAQSFRAPYAFEKDVYIIGSLKGTEDLQPELLSNFDAQLFYNGKNFELAATYFTNKKEDNILRIRNTNTNVLQGGGGDIYANNGEIDSEGIEIEGKYIPNQYLYLTTSYLYQHNTQISDAGTKDQNASLMPSHMLKLGVNYQAPFGLSVGIFNTYVTTFHPIDDRNTVLTRNRDADGFNYMTAQVSIDIVKMFSLEAAKPIILGVYSTNLLDEEIYQPDFAARSLNSIPSRAGRAIYGSLTLKF